MSGIGVVLNPRSRRNIRDPEAASRLSRQLEGHGVVRMVRSLDDLYRAAEDFKRLDIDVLGISGGDGTNHVTITGFINVYAGSSLPQLAFLRGGTMNTVANSFGVPKGRPEGLLGRLIRDYQARASRPLENVERHVLQIGGDYGFLFGTGVVCGYLSEYYAAGEVSPLVAAKTLARGIGSALVGGEMIRRMAQPFRGSVAFPDGSGWPERDYLSVAGGTIEQIGLNFRPFYRCLERPNVFHMVGIHTSPVGFVRDLPRIWRAEAMRPDKTYEKVTDRCVIRGAGPRLRYMIDGDLHEARTPEIEVSVGPRVRILVQAP